MFDIKKAEEVLKGMYSLKIPDSVVAFKFHKFMKVVLDELGDLERGRSNLVEIHGEKKEDGSTQVTEENMSAFFEEYQKLLMLEINFPEFRIPVKKLDMFQLSSEEIGLIEWLIEEGE